MCKTVGHALELATFASLPLLPDWYFTVNRLRTRSSLRVEILVISRLFLVSIPYVIFGLVYKFYFHTYTTNLRCLSYYLIRNLYKLI